MRFNDYGSFFLKSSTCDVPGCTITAKNIGYTGDPCNPDFGSLGCLTNTSHYLGNCLCLNMNGQPCGVCYGPKAAYKASADKSTCFSNSLI